MGNRHDTDVEPSPSSRSDRAALAAENARLNSELQAARAEADLAATKIGTLQAFTAALSSTTTRQEVIDLAMEQVLHHLEPAASVFYVFADGAFQLVSHTGVPATVDDKWRTLPVTSRLPLADAIRDQQALWIEDRATLLTTYPHLHSSDTPISKVQSVIALPLVVHGASVGGLALSFSTARSFSLLERSVLLSMAGQIAQALERGRLLEVKEATRLRLQQNEARYRYIFEAAAVGIAEKDYTEVKRRLDPIVADGVTDLRGFLADHPELVDEAIDLVRVRDVNAAMMRLFHAKERSELFALRPIFLPESRALFIEELVALMDGTRIVSGETPLRTLDGERINVVATIAFPPSGCDRVLISRTDITDQKQVLDERERLVDQLRQTVRINEMFAAILGHDLRNPLGAILTGAQLLLRRTDDEKIQRPIERIVASGQRMGRMIDQLLDVTRARTGEGIVIERRTLALAPICKQIIDELVDANPERTIQLDVVGDTRGSWDTDRLAQVISNLAGNACQHGVSGDPIVVQLDGSDPTTVTLRVTNRGEIPDDVLPVLFDPFRGVQRQRSHANGLGLGLFITKQIVLAHGGTIDVESADGHTRFVARLPRANAELTRVRTS